LKIGRVLELLINSKKASTSPIFEENVESFLCLRFSITHTHDQILSGDIKTTRKDIEIVSKLDAEVSFFGFDLIIFPIIELLMHD
jgi:hypothetical protein